MTPVPSGQDSYAQWDAAYVLGSLSSGERREYETHLVSCRACRGAVAELSGFPALLAMLSPDELAEGDAAVARLDLSGAPRPELLEGLVAEVTRRRRNVRRVALTAAGLAVAGLAAAAMLVFGGLIVWRPAPAAPPHGAVAAQLAMVPVAPSALTATVALTSREWGTDIDMTCTYRADAGDSDDPDDGEQLVLVTVGRDGSRNELASWVERDGATALPTASTAMHVDEIASLEVMSRQTKQTLLRREF